MSEPYSIGRIGEEFVLVYYDQHKKRHRYRLGTRDARRAQFLAPGAYASLIRPSGKTVRELWGAYEHHNAGRAILKTMAYTKKALDRFWEMDGEQITTEDCEAHIKERREAGIKDWTIYTELSHLRTVLAAAEKRRLIARASYIKRPSQPKAKEDYLTRAQAKSLIDSASFPHIRLFVLLALGTGARSGALLGLTWSRCNFDTGFIDLRDPSITMPHKGRAVVPMNNSVREALLDAKAGALSDYVIEWAGKRVASVKRALRVASRAAGIQHTSPHMLRHSAAVHMAEAGIPMDEIAQFLGHNDINVTRKVYARFSPTYLRKAASVLEY